jgi:GNAT superfamily N-acetyltransferase
MRIRHLTLDDVLPLSRLSNQAFLEHARYPEHAAQAADRIQDARDWQWGAFQGNRMLGFLLTEPIAGKERVSIRLLAVDPAAQGKGIGQLLIASLGAEAAKQGYPELRVGTPFARSFYERCGFSCMEISLRMLREIIRQPVRRPQGATVRALDLDTAADLLRSLPSDAVRHKFLAAFLRAHRRHPGLAITVCRKGRFQGVAVGRVSESCPDLAEVTFHHAPGSALKALVQAFEYTVSTFGLRYAGFSPPADQEERFKGLGYLRSEHDFFWTMYTLRKPLP